MQSPRTELAPAVAGQSLRVLVWDRDLVDMWCLDADGARVPFRGQGSTWHCHGELELTFLTRGDGVLAVGDHLGRFGAPDAVLIGCDVPHVWRCRGRSVGIALQFRIGTDRTTGDASRQPSLAGLPELAGPDRLWQRAGHGLRWRGTTAEVLLTMARSLEGTPALGRLATFLTMVGAMRAGLARDALPLSEQVLATTPSAQGDGMRRVLDHLLRRYRDDLRLGDAVRLSGMSQATFCRRFAAATGRTFTAYVTALRLHDVRRALADSDRPITDAAFAAGFNNLSHFHAVFRREVGCTPREYRRRMGEVGHHDVPA